MSYSVVSAKLTDGQLKKLRSKSAKQCGITITLARSQMTGGNNNVSLTARQLKHFNDARKTQRGVQIAFSAAAINNMIKSGGIFPLLAAIAEAAPAVLKASALGAVGTAAGMALKKATGSGYTKGTRTILSRKGSKTTGNPVLDVQRIGSATRTGLLTREYTTLLSNFDLIDAASALALKKLQSGLYERSNTCTTQPR